MPTFPSDLRTHPDIVRLAEDRARRHFAVEMQMANERSPGAWAEWAELDPYNRREQTEVQMRLLLDPKAPDVDGLCRLLAARVGIMVGSTAPTWSWEEYRRDSRDPDGAPNGDGAPDRWALIGAEDIRYFVGEEDWDQDFIVVLGIADIADPFAALVAALFATTPKDTPA